jgi:hypothetical protein
MLTNELKLNVVNMLTNTDLQQGRNTMGERNENKTNSFTVSSLCSRTKETQKETKTSVGFHPVLSDR